MIGWWAYGVISDQRDVAREASREDLRGQIVAYAAAFGSTEEDLAEGMLTSPYTTPLVQKLQQKKNLVEAIVDAHQQVLVTSRGAERPLLSTSLNGQIYLHQQPRTRRKRVLAISVDDPRSFNKLEGRDMTSKPSWPRRRVAFSRATSPSCTIRRREIEDAIGGLARTLRQQEALSPKRGG